MTRTCHREPRTLTRRDRLLATSGGLGLLVVLAVACRLQPDARGHGTHQQLGLPPCTFGVLFGKPCPMCGMTTSWARVVRGQWFGAFRANVAGALLAMLSLAAVPWALASAARARWLGFVPTGWVAAGIAVALMLIALIDWSVRLSGG